MRFRHYLAKILYNFIWMPWQLTLRYFFHYQVMYEDRSVQKLRGPLLIIANHSSWIDPFLISSIFPIGASIFPIRFATDARFFRVPLVNIFLWAIGSFPIYKKIGLQKTLKKPIEILDKKGTVGIFPQGVRYHGGRPKKGRRGAAYLALAADTSILPVYIKGTIGLGLRAFFKREKSITLYSGKVFRIPKDLHEARDVDKATEFLMEKIEKIRETHT